MEKRIKAVIFDWAGTVVDYGCFAPVQAFIDAFQAFGIEITTDEARKPMGLLKKDHIKSIVEMERVQKLFQERFNRSPNTADVEELYTLFEKSLLSSLHQFTDPIPGVLDVIRALREKDIKIGSTTGYTRKMMNTVEKHAKEKGYQTDCIVCADEVKKGRPSPFMIFENMIQLDVFPPRNIIKVGDTPSDIKEGKNAGVWSIGIIKGSSELGLTEAEVNELSDDAYKLRADQVKEKFTEAGVDFVIDSISELPRLIVDIEEKL
ncbi:phosphonoacetaldehyde hydrolase [Oceanobacillus sp. CAU 1775]